MKLTDGRTSHDNGRTMDSESTRESVDVFPLALERSAISVSHSCLEACNVGPTSLTGSPASVTSLHGESWVHICGLQRPLPLTTAQWLGSVVGQSKGDTWAVGRLQSTTEMTSISSQSQPFRNVRATFTHGHGDAIVGWCVQPTPCHCCHWTTHRTFLCQLVITVNQSVWAGISRIDPPFQQPALCGENWDQNVMLRRT